MEQNAIKLPKFKLNSQLLKLHYTYESLVVAIIEELNKIPNLQQLKLNPELTKMLCCVVENITVSKTIKGKIDKKTLVGEVLTKVFDLTEPEQLLVGNDIDFMCNNNLVKGMGMCEKISRFFFFKQNKDT